MISVLIRFLCAGLLLGGIIPVVQAQRTQGGEPPKALEGIAPAGGECRAGDLAKGGMLFDMPVAETADFGCAIDSDRLQALLQGPDLMLADLRRPDDFSAFHIVSAVNVSATALGSKPYWREKTLVLVGNGKAEYGLYILCARLKRSGYKRVHVLQGGMAQWSAQSLPVYGEPSESGSQRRLSATELWQEARNPGNLMLLNDDLAGLAEVLPGARRVASASVEAVTAALRAKQKERGAGSMISAVILVTGAEIDEARLAGLTRAAGPVPVLVYSGSSEDYRRQIAIQEAVWKAYEHGPKVPRCGT